RGAAPARSRAPARPPPPKPATTGAAGLEPPHEAASNVSAASADRIAVIIVRVTTGHKAFACLLTLAACSGPPAAPGQTREQVLGSNALTTNAFSSNAFSSNAFSSNAFSSNAFSSNAFSSNALLRAALTSTEPGPGGATAGELTRQFLTYAYSCAMPEGSTLHIVIDGDDLGTYQGALGLAPEWGAEGGHCDERCQRWVTACLLARTNFWGVPV